MEIHHSRRGTTVSISVPNTGTSQTTSPEGHVGNLTGIEVQLWLETGLQKRHILGGRAAHRMKHITDRLFALVGLLALAPLLMIIAVAVAFSGPGPVLFVHERIGRNGKPFRMWKFRTMRTGTDDQLAELLHLHGRDDEPFFKVPNDPRVTRLGYWLRRWSLDELPQLWNVLVGHMSLVGPRPQVSAEVALYGEREQDRLRVRPGLTGLWQVSGRSQLPWKQAIGLDLYYVDNWSLLMDLKILVRTIEAVINGRGAT
jgi:lipopolysaccharide/colanic/teichoic acid biosynthesis glycosyltransferase